MDNEGARVSLAYETAYGRLPTEKELRRTLAFLEECRKLQQSDVDVWTGLCHTLIGSAEFRYLR